MLSMLNLTDSWDCENEIMAEHIKEKSLTIETVQILEAGCGQAWYVNLDGIKYILTGVDIDKAALEIRKNDLNDLDEIIEGDLRSVKIPANHYDVVYSSFVLEHIENAEQVLSNFVDWVKPMGTIVIRIPDPNSVQGFITRITPHWFHVFYYRYLLGDTDAGKAGHAPYPVHYDRVVSRDGMREYCESNNLKIVAEYGDGWYRPGRGAVVRSLIHSFKQSLSLLSFGMLSSKHTNLLYILQKQS